MGPPVNEVVTRTLPWKRQLDEIEYSGALGVVNLRSTLWG